MLANILADSSGKKSAFRIINPEKSVITGQGRVYWENMICNPWQEMLGILQKFPKYYNVSQVTERLEKITQDDFELLGKVVIAIVHLGRVGEIIPGISRVISFPNTMDSFLLTAFQDSACVGSNPDIADTIAMRYALAYWIAWLGGIFNIRVNHCDDTQMARALCCCLFSRPYRKDWSTCDMEEMLRDADYIHKTYVSNAPLMQNTYWKFDGYSFVRDRYINFGIVYWLAKNLGTLRYMANYAKNIELPEFRQGISEDGHLENAFRFAASAPCSPLPDYAFGLCVNPLSDAYVPMYAARDNCNMPIVLIPETQEIWDAMCNIYGIPERDLLYPESISVLERLSPRNTHFAVETAEANKLIYLGIQNLCEYILDLPDCDNPDYRFHAFMVERQNEAIMV